MSAPVVFLSYSHDTPSHKEWVLRLATALRGLGVDTILDQWDLTPGQDTVAFMEGSIARADRVLLICTEQYVDKANDRAGGVGYERLVVTGELVARIDTKKFVPIVRQRTKPPVTPHYLGPRLYLDFSDDTAFDHALASLAREIHGVPQSSKPPVGENPFAGTAPPSPEPNRSVGPTGFTARGMPVLDEQWFGTLAARATKGIGELGRTGYMEARSALHEPQAKSQLDLLNAMRKAEIKTFGWPIGLLLESRDEYRPRPTADGISAEVAIRDGKGHSGQASYDLWAARNNGDFYLLQSLFEDERGTSALFFNTRIVRIAETFLFLAGFYENLGVDAVTRVSVRIAHRGLAGRTLTSAGGTRHIRPRTSLADESDRQVEATVGELRERTPELVMQVAEPLFMLFDFAAFAESIYRDIVEKFRSGHVT